jgi:hypothetical protein
VQHMLPLAQLRVQRDRACVFHARVSLNEDHVRSASDRDFLQLVD